MHRIVQEAHGGGVYGHRKVIGGGCAIEGRVRWHCRRRASEQLPIVAESACEPAPRAILGGHEPGEGPAQTFHTFSGRMALYRLEGEFRAGRVPRREPFGRMFEARARDS